jgi:hypothetical protein
VRRIFAKVHDDAPLIPLWTVYSIYGVGRSLHWKPTPNVSWPVLWNVRRSA